MSFVFNCMFVEPVFFDNASDANTKDASETASGIEEQSHPKIPIDHSGLKQSCSICHEQFATEWDEELEDWILCNAIKADGKLVHLQCYRDQGKASTVQSVLGKRPADSKE